MADITDATKAQKVANVMALLRDIFTCQHGNRREIIETGIYVCLDCGRCSYNRWAFPLKWEALVKAFQE